MPRNSSKAKIRKSSTPKKKPSKAAAKELLLRRRLAWCTSKAEEANEELEKVVVRFHRTPISHANWKKMRDKKEAAQRELLRWTNEIQRLDDLIRYGTSKIGN